MKTSVKTNCIPRGWSLEGSMAVKASEELSGLRFSKIHGERTLRSRWNLETARM